MDQVVKKEVPTITVGCQGCSRSFETTEGLLRTGKAKCPYCGASYEVVEEYDWERFQHMCMLDPKDIPVAVRGAIWDLKRSVDSMRQLIDEPVNVLMELMAEIQAQRTKLDRWQDSWDTMEQTLANACTLDIIDGEALLGRMRELRERLDNE
jgi:uncharacterized Zn finger protein (UPF0148 family)